MASIIRKFISQDAYGESVGLNYKGESNYKTGLGALCSILLRTFMLTYLILGLIDLFNYQDPQIIQVSFFQNKVYNRPFF